MITPPLLPPRGVFIPTQMIFNPQLPPAILVTWIQLRTLAWGGWVTPAFSIQELAVLTGKSQAQLYRHISQLRSMGTLQWSLTGEGLIIISFPDLQIEKPKVQSRSPNFPDSKVLNPKIYELPDPASYFPTRILGYLSYQDDQEGFPEFSALQT